MRNLDDLFEVVLVISLVGMLVISLAKVVDGGRHDKTCIGQHGCGQIYTIN